MATITRVSKSWQILLPDDFAWHSALIQIRWGPTVEMTSLDVVQALRVRTADMRRLGPVATKLESTGKWLLPHAESGINGLTEELLLVARLYPTLRIYLPHMGWPRRDLQDDNSWSESVAALCKIPNLIVGISAIAHFSREPFPAQRCCAIRCSLAVDFRSRIAGSCKRLTIV